MARPSTFGVRCGLDEANAFVLQYTRSQTGPGRSGQRLALRWARRQEHRRRRWRSRVDFAVPARRDRHARRKPFRSRVVVPCGPNFHEVDMRARSEEKRSEAKKGKLEKPANHYKSPDDIVKDKDLSPAEKRQALNTWEQDARQMLTASNEGMEGDQEGLDQRDSHRLGEVVRAKDKIGAKPKPKHSH
jgi:hypothetical protein